MISLIGIRIFRVQSDLRNESSDQVSSSRSHLRPQKPGFFTGRKNFVETWFLAPYAPRTGICEETWFLASARSVLIYFKSAVQELNLPGANYEFAA